VLALTATDISYGAVSDSQLTVPGADSAEVVDLKRPAAGSYVAEVTPFTGVSQNYTVTAAPYALKHEVSPTGAREVYEMSCEDAKGNVLSRQSIYVQRGQTLSVNPHC